MMLDSKLAKAKVLAKEIRLALTQYDGDEVFKLSRRLFTLYDELALIEVTDTKKLRAFGYMFKWLTKIQELSPEIMMKTMPAGCPGLGALEEFLLNMEKMGVDAPLEIATSIHEISDTGCAGT